MARPHPGLAGAGGLVDVGDTWLYRRNGLAGTTKTALHPNLGFEQNLFARAFALRAGRDETSYGAGFSLRRPRFRQKQPSQRAPPGRISILEGWAWNGVVLVLSGRPRIVASKRHLCARR